MLVFEGYGDTGEILAHFRQGKGNLDAGLGGGELSEVPPAEVLEIESAVERLIEGTRDWNETGPGERGNEEECDRPPKRPKVNRRKRRIRWMRKARRSGCRTWG